MKGELAMLTKSEEQLAAKIGKRMREVRKQKNITLIELSKTTDVAQATLSRMENGQMLGTVESHRKIAEALGVTLSSLYEGIDARSEGVRAQKATDKRRVLSKNDSARAELLLSNPSSKKIVPVLITLSANGKTTMDHGERGVEKFVWVVEGDVKVVFDNAEYELQANDSLYFDASASHQIVNSGSRSAKVFSVSSK